VWLVVCQDGDVDAAELALGLRDLGLDPLELVVASELVHGARWEHRVGAWGAHTRLRLADGRDIDSAAVCGVLNRLVWITAEGFVGASDVDREYAGGELHALVQSWLEGFGRRAVNRPAGLGLSGPFRTSEEWRALAREAQLEIRAFPESADGPLELSPVLIIDGEVVDDGGAPAPVRTGALRLAAQLDHDLVELHFDGDWRFAHATLMPALANGGDARVRAVAGALRARAAA
jgi:hypothetical protein